MPFTTRMFECFFIHTAPANHKDLECGKAKKKQRFTLSISHLAEKVLRAESRESQMATSSGIPFSLSILNKSKRYFKKRLLFLWGENPNKKKDIQAKIRASGKNDIQTARQRTKLGRNRKVSHPAHYHNVLLAFTLSFRGDSSWFRVSSGSEGSLYLKYWRSLGRRHGIVLLAPIPRFLVAATTREKGLVSIRCTGFFWRARLRRCGD